MIGSVLHWSWSIFFGSLVGSLLACFLYDLIRRP